MGVKSLPAQFFFILLSLIIVGFGQPAWNWVFGLLAAAFGYALFWNVLLSYQNRLTRFWIGTLWFTCVQLVQLSWATSHPYLYIYLVYPLFSFLIGLQFGLLCLFITPSFLNRISLIAFIAALWTLFEWARLFFFSGYSWNPIGLSLTSSIYPLQTVAFWGVFGLSFWVMFVNLLALRAWQKRTQWMPGIVWICAAFIPYLFGFVHTNFHERKMAASDLDHFHVVLIQTTFPAEEATVFSDRKNLIAHVIDEWKQILIVSKKQLGHKIDLIVLPEYTVPCGTYTCVFPYQVVRDAFKEILGEKSVATLPALEAPFAWEIKTNTDSVYLVNNAFWAQGIANAFDAGLVIGLEDVDETSPGHREHYSAALYFKPHTTPATFNAERYEKRVLVPLGEYIPFEFCRTIAAEYGIHGSFTSGKEAKVFTAGEKQLPFGLSICYEETFGNLMRENKLRGASLLVNLTSGAWYPGSRLPWQHFTHSRLRTVESGIPLVRATNIEITAAVDSLGQTLKMANQEESSPDWVMESLYVKVPLYTYPTVYSHVGDSLIIGFCLSMIIFGLRKIRL